MNDLHFIKYKPRMMMLDMKGMSAHAKVAHFQLFNMTIINDGPYPDDERILLDIADCPKKLWPSVRKELVWKGYKSVGGFFFHAGTIATLNESKMEFVKSFNRTAAANEKPPLKLSAPDPVTGCVTYHVTSSVTLAVTDDVAPGVTLTQTDRRTDGQPQLLSTTKLPASSKSNKKFSQRQTEITARFDKALGKEWENDRQKWMGRIANEPDKSERVVAEVENAIKESRIKTTSAQYAEQTWKEFQ